MKVNHRIRPLLGALVVSVGAVLAAPLAPSSYHAVASPKPHAASKAVYVALGASDTVGVGTPDPARDNWTAQLSKRLPKGSRYLNLGVSGITLGAAQGVELPRALAAHPTVVTVWLAVNDLNAQVPSLDYGREIDQLLASLQATHARVFVGNVPDLSLVPVYQKSGVPLAQIDAAVQAYNSAIAAAATRHGATVVDLYTHSKEIVGHSNYISGDGFHPSIQGYALLANYFYSVMHTHKAL